MSFFTAIVSLSCLYLSLALQSSSFLGGKVVPRPRLLVDSSNTLSNRWTMRDASASYWFDIGDRVSVVEDVMLSGQSLKGRHGVVVETWEKCDVDPTCCCAEQVDENMAVRVQFFDDDNSTSFYHYFGENELIKEKDQPEAFDGMTCMAFKLDKLDKFQKPRRIASFDPQKMPE